MDAFPNEKILMFLSIFTRSSDPWVVGDDLIGLVTSREEIPDMLKVGRINGWPWDNDMQFETLNFILLFVEF